MAEKLTAQTVIPLYPGEIPGAIADKAVQETSESKGGVLRIAHVVNPTLTAYLPTPEKATGMAVIICPGGGYGIVAIDHEGIQVARLFQENGIAAFVLKYRLPDDRIMKDKSSGPLQDAQTAIQLVRTTAKEWGIDPHKIGIMGFSAGGHLAATAGTLFNQPVIANPQNISLRPDFMVLCYPVISFADSIGHIGSRNALLGNNASDDMIKKFSAEQNVSSETPPSFIMLSQRDEVVNMNNGLMFFQQLALHNVHSELHVYDDKTHGYGLNIPATREKWIYTLLNWLQSGKPFLSK